ncbi:MAG: hypothetical protein JO325_01755 [Solirubrobacterales bacterium]|nr:hypothetical protein [Solirubrobacterales bacterium]
MLRGTERRTQRRRAGWNRILRAQVRKDRLPKTTLLAQVVQMRLAGRERTPPEALVVRRRRSLPVEDHPLPPLVLYEDVELDS